MIEQLQESVNAALAEGKDFKSVLPEGEWTVLVNSSDNTATISPGFFNHHTVPPYLTVHHVTVKTNKPQLDHDNNGKAGGSLPKAEPVKRKPVRK